MDTVNYKRTKYACYLTSISMSISANLSPLLFLTFRNMYDLSYTLIGLLVVINFVTQLLIDLVFTFFSKCFNIHKTVRLTPFVVFCGLILYGVMPRLFPSMAFLWIVIGTVIFSVSSGLAEVLLSPVIAAIPSENPEREMSKLHSMYAWGVVGVVIISTAFIAVFGSENWMYLALLWSIEPLVAFFLMRKAVLPKMDDLGGGNKSGTIFNKGILLCVFCIFLGGAAECTMSQWASGFIEEAVGVPKIFGDVLGVALFGVLLGIGRSGYAKYGRNIGKILTLGMIGAAVCYFTAGLSMNPVVAVMACALTGICTSMLWPGSLIYIEENVPNVGVAVYALMAAGGDLGASVAPQLVGIISDKFSVSDIGIKLAETLSVEAEQVGMRAGLIVAGLFPLAGFLLVIYMKRYFKRRCMETPALKGENK